MTSVRAIVSIGLAAIWLWIVAPPIFQHYDTAYTGVALAPTSKAFSPNVIVVDPGSPAHRAGLRSGDVLECLSPRDQTILLSIGVFEPNDSISACVRHGSSWKAVTFQATRGAALPNEYGNDVLASLRLLIYVLFLIVGIWLLLAKPSLMTWIFYFCCLGNCPNYISAAAATRLTGEQYLFVAIAPAFVAFMATGLLMIFAVLVPDTGFPRGWRRVAFYATAAFAFVGALLWAVWNADTSLNVAQWVIPGILLLQVMITILSVVARLVTMSVSERAKLAWCAVGIVIGAIAGAARIAFPAGFLNSIPAYATVALPLCLTYAILRNHVIDVRFIISRTVLYGVVTTLLVGIFGLVEWLTSAFLNQVRYAAVIDAGITIALVFVLHRAYDVIEHGVEFVLFRKKLDAEIYLNRLAKTLLRASSESTIDEAIVNAPYEAFELTMAVLFRANGSDFAPALATTGRNGSSVPVLSAESELVRFLVSERSKVRISELRDRVAIDLHHDGVAPAMAVPLLEGDTLLGFVLYGLHRDGTQIDPDEATTLERLCEAAAQAYAAIELRQYRSLTHQTV